MKWLLIAGLALVVLGVLAAAAGTMLPRAHVARRSLRLDRPTTAEVWAVVADIGGASAWRPDVKKVDRTADRNGHAVWIEHGANGDLAFEVLEATPPRRLVTKIVDSSMFGGTWTYDVDAPAGATVLTITENGWVSNPIFRLVAKYVFGHHATIDAYLKNLASRFGEAADLAGK
jgi:Polyketide cyclase / dehydrase and lipid transport